MSDADALRRAIAAQPDDDLPRLALADLLDESGDPARAEFIRAQVALAQLPDHHPDRPALEDREHNLLAAHEADWLADFVDGQAAPTSELFEWEWERGFLNEIAATPLFLLDRGPDLFAAHPVRRWRVMGSGGAMAQDLIEAGRAPWVARLEAVDLAGWFQTVGELERFLTRSDLARLRELDLTDRWGLDDLPDILGRTPFRDQLTSLRCGPTGEADGCGVLDMRNLIRSLMGARLVELSTRGCGLTSADLQLLFTASCGGELFRHDVSDNWIDFDGDTPFLHPTCLLRVLDLSGNGLGMRGLDSLLGWGRLDQLLSLDLNRCVPYGAVLHAVVSEQKRQVYTKVPPGENWRDLPDSLRQETMGAAYKAEGGKSGWWRRLSWGQPAPTILGMPDHSSTGLIHPDEVRCLSVNECAAIQTFRDVRFAGKPRSQYQQIGNAVPVLMAQCLGEHLLRFFRGDRLPTPSPPSWRQESANRRIGTHGWSIPWHGKPSYHINVAIRDDHIWNGGLHPSLPGMNPDSMPEEITL